MPTGAEVISGKYLDENQLNINKKFNAQSWLSNKLHIFKLIAWVTFYRRNLPAFVTHYLGIKLYIYQIVCLYLLNIYNSIDIVASRATAKSWLIAVFACSKAILYPNSLVVISSATRGQSKLIVSAKIKNELMRNSKNLCREIESIKDNTTETVIYFRNGSTITVVPASENGRGFRSTLLILEEFRQIKKNVKDSILIPFSIARTTPFRNNPLYENLIEEATIVGISSSWRTSHWMWKEINDLLKSKFKDNSACVIAMDYAVSLKHGIKTKRQLEHDKSVLDPITWRIEYENEMLKENTNAYFTYAMCEVNQVNKKAFYPQTTENIINKNKNKFAIQKQPNEVRILSADIAFVAKDGNDNSAFSLMRLLPESTEYVSNNVDGKRVEVKQGYRRVVSYIEANQGGDVDKQAIRLKQLYYDFDCDYLVIDTRNGGILLYDRLAKVIYDEERDCEYPAWRCFNDEATASRIKVNGALNNVFAINATQKLNSDIAISMREVLTSRRIDFLVNLNDIVDKLQEKIPEYANDPDGDIMNFYERPYLETQKLIYEMVSLEYSLGENTNVIKISEQGANTKDRYTSVSYGSYFAGLLENDLLGDSEEYGCCTFTD